MELINFKLGLIIIDPILINPKLELKMYSLVEDDPILNFESGTLWLESFYSFCDLLNVIWMYLTFFYYLKNFTSCECSLTKLNRMYAIWREDTIPYWEVEINVKTIARLAFIVEFKRDVQIKGWRLKIEDGTALRIRLLPAN